MIVADEALARRVELLEARAGAQSAKAFLTAAGDATPSSAELAGGIMNFGGVDSPMTQAIALAIGVDVDDEAIERMEAFYFDRGAAVAAFVCPWTSASFTDRLAPRGYRISEYNAVFARPLSSADRLCRRQENIVVARAVEKDFDDACRVAAGAFADEHMTADLLIAMMRPIYQATGMRVWVARIDDRIVGSALSFVDEELRLIGLFGAATELSFRNRGVQAALLEARLSDGVTSECELAMVSTMPGSASHRNVARRGFELLYNRFVMRRQLPR